MSNKKDPVLSSSIWEMGLDDKSKALLRDIYKIRICQLPMKPEMILDTNFPKPEIVLCGSNTPSEVRAELVQIVGLKYVGTPILFVSRDYQGLNRTRILSEGFTEVFLIPFEQTFFEEYLNPHLSTQESEIKKMFEAVRVADIVPDTEVNFDVNLFLRANRKFICFARKGQKISKDRLDKLKEKSATVYISKEEMNFFVTYVENEIKRCTSKEKSGATARRDRYVQTVKDFFREYLYTPRRETVSPIKANKLLENCRATLNLWMMGLSNSQWKERFLENTGDYFDMSYIHACNTGLYAGLISQALEIGNPMEIALAGILHDTGLVFLPEEVLEKKYDQLTINDKKVYQTHVQRTVNEIITRGLDVNANVTKIISQHHESYCGSGFPAKLKGSAVCPEAQILSIAERLDELTSFTNDRDGLSPLLAMRHIMNEENQNIAIKKTYEPALAKRVSSFFESVFKS